jgi:hypothetical protein
MMEIRIGIQNISREITLESDQSAETVSAAVAQALAGTALDLTDSKGRRVLVPTAALGYVELGTEEKRRVGFGG